MSFRISRIQIGLVALALFITGCLPGSCQRQEDRSLFPADSLSRDLAAEVPTDTLAAKWHSAGPEDGKLQFPRTVLFKNGGGLAVSDAERESIFEFSDDGVFQREVGDLDMQAPYLIGTRGDTLLVLSPFERRVDFLQGASHTGSLNLPIELPDESPLLWGAASDEHIYVKVLGDDVTGQVKQFDNDGELIGHHDMPGPTWRRAGLMRVWGDSLLSLSGFRPVVDVLPRDLRSGYETAPDTMALVGFDSPMLSRSRAFVEGDVSDGPILSESAMPVGNHLFVLNIRPGWIQVDVYDRDGKLQRKLTQDETVLARNFYPRDLAVRQVDEGYDIAIVYTDPEPRIALFHWSGM